MITQCNTTTSSQSQLAGQISAALLSSHKTTLGLYLLLVVTLTLVVLEVGTLLISGIPLSM